MKPKVSRVFWGIFFLACATFVVLNQMGIWTYKLGFWAVVGSIIFLLTLIDGIINLRITESVFSIAFILMIFAQPLHITKLVPWTLLLAALLISIGLGIIFRNRFHTVVYAHKKIKNFNDKRKSISDNIFTNTVSNDKGAHVVINQTMSDTSRYIHSKELEDITIKAKMSDINVYLDDAEAKGDLVTLNLDTLMCEVTIYLPLSWQIDDQTASGLGAINIYGQSNGGGPTLRLLGKQSMGNISIKYI